MSVPIRRQTFAQEPKPHPARILSKQAETLMDKFRRRIRGASQDDGDGNSEEGVDFSLASTYGGVEQIDRIVDDNRSLYVTKY